MDCARHYCRDTLPQVGREPAGLPHEIPGRVIMKGFSGFSVESANATVSTTKIRKTYTACKDLQKTNPCLLDPKREQYDFM
eukprot:6198436-Pyramimonas_sp.AAC.1